MALFKTSALMADIKGMVGGSLFNSGRGGKYISNQSQKVGNIGSRNQSQKAKYASACKAWRELTRDQIVYWQNLASQNRRKDKMGNSIQLTPFQYFVSAFLNPRLVVTTVNEHSVVDKVIDGVLYRVITWLNNGQLTVNKNIDIDYLIVGGGGAGGGTGTANFGTGGGGGGAVVQGSVKLLIGSTSIEVGQSVSGSATFGANGLQSSIGTIVALGGGGGGGTGQLVGRGNGCGGGGASDGTLRVGGVGSQGGDGGNASLIVGTADDRAGGGGGGAGGNGFNSSASVGGDGGIGVESNINGTPTFYGGGGGGATRGLGGVNGIGGNGGGANGRTGGNIIGFAGTNGLGGGGGGVGRSSGTTVGGNGGSGVVILRYRL